MRVGFSLCVRATLGRLVRNLPWIAIATAVAVAAVPPLAGSGSAAAGVASRWLLLPCVLSSFVAIGGICTFWPTLSRDSDAASWTARLHRGPFGGAGVALTAALLVITIWLWALGCCFAGVLAQAGRLPSATWSAIDLSTRGVAPILAPGVRVQGSRVRGSRVPVVRGSLTLHPDGGATNLAGVELRTRLLWDGQEAFQTPRVLVFDGQGNRLTADAVALDGTPRRIRWPARRVGSVRLELQQPATAGLEIRPGTSFGIDSTPSSVVWNGGMAALGCLPGAILGGSLALMLSGMLALRLLIVSTMIPVLLGTLLDWSSATHAIDALATGRRITPALWLDWSWTALAAATGMVSIGWLGRRFGTTTPAGGITC